MTTSDDALPGRPPSDEGALPDGTLPDALPEQTVDGYSVERLSDYLDSGRTPRDPGIEGSAACRLYLISLAQVHDLSRASLAHEATREPDRDGRWISSLLESIRREVVGGREIPIGHPDAGLDLRMTEAAARGLVRRTGDADGGVVLGATAFTGDVTTPGAPVTVEVTAAVRYGDDMRVVADALRARIVETLTRHTHLTITAVDIVIDDVFLPRTDDR
jgi:hypothetical protein